MCRSTRGRSLVSNAIGEPSNQPAEQKQAPHVDQGTYIGRPVFSSCKPPHLINGVLHTGWKWTGKEVRKTKKGRSLHYIPVRSLNHAARQKWTDFYSKSSHWKEEWRDIPTDEEDR